jgi:hypothetical protein
MRIQSHLDLILLVIACEAIVNIIFNTGIFRPVREWVIKHTPFLSVGDEHLLSCKICTSFWIGILCVFLYQFYELWLVRFTILALSVHRLSNYLHLLFSLIKDMQFDIRVNRNKG